MDSILNLLKTTLNNICGFLMGYIILSAMTVSYILLAGIITQIERKVLAVFQQRHGPVIVGTRGVLQFTADALKVLFKEVIYLINVKKYMMVSLPIIFLLINVLLTFTLTWSNNLSLLNLEYDFIIIFLVMLLSNIIVIYTGFVIKNKYTQLSSNRAATLGVNMDITLGFFISYYAAQTGSFSLDYLSKMGYSVHLVLSNLPILLPLFCIVLMDLGKAPFDLVEAETELIMGFFIDYSGFMFIIFLLGEYLHMFIMAYFLQLFLIR